MEGGALQGWSRGRPLHTYEPDYSGRHLVVFENELKTPPHTTLCDLEFEEWVREHRHFARNWRIADIDFYMRGNPYYSARVDIRKMEALKPKVRELPSHLVGNVDKVFGGSSVHAARLFSIYDFKRITTESEEEALKLTEQEKELRKWLEEYNGEDEIHHVSRSRIELEKVTVPYVNAFVNQH